MIKRNKRESVLLACIYALSIVLGILHYINSPVPRSLVYVDFIFYILFVDILITAAVLLLAKYEKTELIFAYFGNVFKSIRQGKKRLLIMLSAAVGAVLIACAAEWAISSLIYSSYFIWQRFLFLAAVLLSALIVYFYRGKPERIFLCLSLTIGALFSITTPISYSSFDEESHYQWAVQQSAVYLTYLTEADYDIRSIPQEEYFNKEQRETRLEEKNETGEVFMHYIGRSMSRIYSMIGHIPSGVSIFIGRSLGLSWSFVFIMGRLANLIAYSVIVYFAIRRIKYGKYVIAVIGLLPTILYFAANYSYDNWVISWLILGVAYFVRELQEPRAKAKYSNLAIMVLAFLIGLGPKAVYFPLMFMLFFIGKDKFADEKHYRTYKKILAVSIVFVIVSFVLPFLARPENYSDGRGGDEIDAVSQVLWILSSPLEYSGILIGFLPEYLSVFKAAEYLANYAHLGNEIPYVISHDRTFVYADPYYIYIIIFITAVVFSDKNRRVETINGKLKIATLGASLVCVVLVATALYVSINPVGAEVIEWVQPRYLLPLICPVLLALRSPDIKNSMSKNFYSSAVFGLSAFFLLSSFWSVCISRYH